MAFIPQDGEDLRRLAFSSREGDMQATEIISDVIFYEVRKRQGGDNGSEDMSAYKDITQRGSIEANLGNIKTAIEMGKIRGELKQFRIMSEIQKHFWAATENKRIIIPEFPHHENIVRLDGKWVSQSGLIVAPLSYAFGPIATNPYSFEKTPKENISFVANSGRIAEMIVIMAEYFDISRDEIATAGSVYCYNVVGKRAWSIANKGDIEAGQVGPEHFLAVDRAIQATGYGMRFD